MREKIWRELGQTGFARIYGLAKPYCYYTPEWGKVWRCSELFVFEAKMSGGRAQLTVKRVDLLTFITHTETYTFETLPALLTKLEEIVEREKITTLELEKRIVEPLN
jgi:hypothetical protein